MSVMMRVPGSIFFLIKFINVGPLRSWTISIHPSFVSLWFYMLLLTRNKNTCSMHLQPKLQEVFSQRFFLFENNNPSTSTVHTGPPIVFFLVRNTSEHTSRMYAQKFTVDSAHILSSRWQNFTECASTLHQNINFLIVNKGNLLPC